MKTLKPASIVRWSLMLLVLVAFLAVIGGCDVLSTLRMFLY